MLSTVWNELSHAETKVTWKPAHRESIHVESKTCVRVAVEVVSAGGGCCTIMNRVLSFVYVIFGLN